MELIRPTVWKQLRVAAATAALTCDWSPETLIFLSHAAGFIKRVEKVGGEKGTICGCCAAFLMLDVRPNMFDHVSAQKLPRHYSCTSKMCLNHLQKLPCGQNMIY